MGENGPLTALLKQLRDQQRRPASKAPYDKIVRHETHATNPKRQTIHIFADTEKQVCDEILRAIRDAIRDGAVQGSFVGPRAVPAANGFGAIAEIEWP